MSHRKEQFTVKGKLSGCRKVLLWSQDFSPLGDPDVSRCDVITELNPEKGLDLSVAPTL